MDFPEDPSSALLEVLDPEPEPAPSSITTWRSTYDLSDVMFVATVQYDEYPAVPCWRDGGDPSVRLHGGLKGHIAMLLSAVPKQMKNTACSSEEAGGASAAILTSSVLTLAGCVRRSRARFRRSAARSVKLADARNGGKVPCYRQLTVPGALRRYTFARSPRRKRDRTVTGWQDRSRAAIC